MQNIGRHGRSKAKIDRIRCGHYNMTMKDARRTISAADFKSHCLGLLDQVAATKETLVVTKRGRAVAKLVAMDEGDSKPLRGSVHYHGDIVGPSGEVWDAQQ